MSIQSRAFLPTLTGWGQEHRPVTEAHQSSRPGVFLCGDLAGEPLLKTSIVDAVKTAQAVKNYLTKCNIQADTDFDVIICGAGGAGIAAAMELKKVQLNCLILEKKKIAQTIRDFPEEKIIFARPQNLPMPDKLDFDDCTKEEYLDQINKVVVQAKLKIEENCEIAELQDNPNGILSVITAAGKQYTTKAVIMATGRQGNPKTLNIPGEELSHVHHKLLTPHGYAGKNIIIIGGGNSAVEAAITLSDNSAKVTIAYRRDSFFRASHENRTQLQKFISSEKVKTRLNSTPEKIVPDGIEIKTADGSEKLVADEIFILIGAAPPDKLLDKLDIKIENRWSWQRITAFIASIAALWLFYSFSKWNSGTTIQEFPWSLLGSATERLPAITPGHIKGLLYSLAVLGFGIPAMLRWRKVGRHKKYQTTRYITMFISQVFLLFIFPEFILTLIQPENAWRFYGVMMPFPLVYETFFGNPPLFWIITCATAMLVILPIFIYWHGKRLCSWICGCGCLAETVGDRFRHYAPHGNNSRKIENYLLWPILIWAFLSASIYIIMLSYNAKAPKPIYVSSYLLIIDFILASVIGVSFYFFFGNRIWCRYFCPLAHYMRLLSAIYSKFRIKPADRCIACGECSRYCQMGIDVMQFALKEEEINNKNSSCIGCDICVSVCPMDNLTSGKIFPDQAREEKKVRRKQRRMRQAARREKRKARKETREKKNRG
jgi:putative YpdA family bacillithiol system oxidoreductase